MSENKTTSTTGKPSRPPPLVLVDYSDEEEVTTPQQSQASQPMSEDLHTAAEQLDPESDVESEPVGSKRKKKKVKEGRSKQSSEAIPEEADATKARKENRGKASISVANILNSHVLERHPKLKAGDCRCKDQMDVLIHTQVQQRMEQSLQQRSIWKQETRERRSEQIWNKEPRERRDLTTTTNQLQPPPPPPHGTGEEEGEKREITERERRRGVREEERKGKEKLDG
ncbi:hypothetical protein F2Q68_00015159 [Brassica cretica]|uniref:Uncharacterized protein n=1 Tax=Brassica cretica TaxID=69181 RepID=A0A8S9HCM4_BRACR|nr:hypothetical protein F2Q68_00015159 [Brassica cretica]